MLDTASKSTLDVVDRVAGRPQQPSLQGVERFRLWDAETADISRNLPLHSGEQRRLPVVARVKEPGQGRTESERHHSELAGDADTRQLPRLLSQDHHGVVGLTLRSQRQEGLVDLIDVIEGHRHTHIKFLTPGLTLSLADRSACAWRLTQGRIAAGHTAATCRPWRIRPSGGLPTWRPVAGSTPSSSSARLGWSHRASPAVEVASSSPTASDDSRRIRARPLSRSSATAMASATGSRAASSPGPSRDGSAKAGRGAPGTEAARVPDDGSAVTAPGLSATVVASVAHGTVTSQSSRSNRASRAKWPRSWRSRSPGRGPGGGSASVFHSSSATLNTPSGASGTAAVGGLSSPLSASAETLVRSPPTRRCASGSTGRHDARTPRKSRIVLSTASGLASSCEVRRVSSCPRSKWRR